MKVSFQYPLKSPGAWLFSAQLTLLAITAAIYWPGLAGPFLFDDFASLNALGSYGGVVDWDTLKLFVLGNQTGPAGRPVSMLSFLLNDMAWPSDARSFKYTNLMLHLINGMLLYMLVYKILRQSSLDEASCLGIALLIAGIWLLHPLNVSTVLYPVQRMTILATLFVLTSLSGYVYARELLLSRPLTGYLLMSISLVIGSLLAVFSKENGALLFLLAWVIEFTCLSKNGAPGPNKYWQMVFFRLPAGLLVAYFIYLITYGNLLSGYDIRDFTLAERLLTQPRVLFDYLYFWYLPQASSPGLLTQDFPISRGLFTPLSTIVSISGIAAILMSAFWLHRRFPLYALAVLYYFTGHLLESTLIPLELYFEHRNYLPGVFLALPLAIPLYKLLQKNRLWLILPAILLLIPAQASVHRVSFWENDETLAYHWAQIHPHSQRAQRHAALVAENHNKLPMALSILHKTKSEHPDRIATHLHWLTLACRFTRISDAQKSSTLNIMQTGKFSFRNTNLLLSSTRFIASQNCAGGGLAFSLDILDALGKNPIARKLPGAMHQLSHARGIISLSATMYEQAAMAFRESLQHLALVETGLVQVSLLASSGQFRLAMGHLQYIEANVPLSHKAGELDYASELARLRNNLIHDMKNDDQTE